MNEPAKPCIFCRIIAGFEKKYTVFESSSFLAILDTRPLFPGHTLLLPKKHFETMYDLDPALAQLLIPTAQTIGKAIETATASQGTFVAINNTVSQSVPHVHMHIVPRNKGDGLKGFFWPRNAYTDENHILETQRNIQKFLKEQP